MDYTELMEYLKILLKESWRDIVSFLIIGIILSAAIEFLIKITTAFDIIGGSLFISLLQGFVKFAGANLCLWFLGMGIAFPFVTKWIHSDFNKTWNEISGFQRLYCFVGIFIGEAIMAAICFS